MTEDLHDDIDDLFRSGLEGKEDMPSPDVWAAISKGLPSTPPPAATPAVPGATTSPAAGGWTSSLIAKGIIGAVIIAVLGTTAYFMTSSEKPTSEPDNTKTHPQNTDIQQTHPDLINNDVAAENSSAGSVSDQAQTSNKETESSDNRSLISEKAEHPVPAEKMSDLKPEDRDEVGLKEAVKIEGRDRPEILGDRSSSGKMISAVTHAIPGKNTRVSSNDRLNQGALRTLPIEAENKRSVSSPNNNQKPVTDFSEQTVDRATVNIIHKHYSSDKKVAPSFLIPTSSFLPGLTLQSTKTADGMVKFTSPRSAKPLKRNDWTSKIYLTPVISLNMTKMDVEENESYGPRIGREHIEFRETEDTRTTLSPGLIAGYALTPRISVQTGISELKNNISVSPKQIRAVRDRDGKVRYRMDCSSGSYFLEPKAGTSPGVGDSLKIASSEIKMRYVSIPLSVRVNFGNDRLRLFATAGTDINILAGKQTSTSLSASSSDKVSPVRSEGTRKQYVNGTLGAGVEIRAGKRLGIMLMPHYRFPLGIINEEGPVLTYPKTFSVTSGVRIGF